LLLFRAKQVQSRLDFEQKSIFIRLFANSGTKEADQLSTAETKRLPKTSGLVLHKAAQYDHLLWLLTLGREQAFRERALGLANLSAGESVLDVGCGTGTLAIAAKRQVGQKGYVCSVDASPEMIARAGKKASKAGVEVDFKEALVESLPFRDGQFDVVLSTLMLHHLPGKLRSMCATEVRRVLKPGGRLLAIDFGTSPGQKGIVAHFHRHGHISLVEMVALSRDAGLKIAESGTVGIGDLEYVLAVAPCCEPSA
jgi:ubiquinone/menaquinone biosynthesis C-methylase UbiE